MNHQLHQTEQLMLNFGEMTRYQPITSIDPRDAMAEVERLVNGIYALCSHLGIGVSPHISLHADCREQSISPPVLLGRLVRLQYDLLHLTHTFGYGRYLPAGFTEFYNSQCTLFHSDGRIRRDSNNRPIEPSTFREPDYPAVLDLYNPLPLFADHVNPPIQTDDASGTSFTD